MVKYRFHVFVISFIRFLDPENICFDIKIMILHGRLAKILAFIGFDGGHFEKIHANRVQMNSCLDYNTFGTQTICTHFDYVFKIILNTKNLYRLV